MGNQNNIFFDNTLCNTKHFIKHSRQKTTKNNNNHLNIKNMETTQKTTENRREQLGLKVLVISFLCLLLLVPWLLIRSTIDERRNTENFAEQEVFEKWGSYQVVKGPAIHVTSDKEQQDFLLLPETLEIESDAQTRTLNRGIYDFTVYDAQITLHGEFILPKNIDRTKADRLSLNQWKMETELTSLKGLTDNPTITVNGKKLSQQEISFEDSRIMWSVDVEPLLAGNSIEYEIVIPIRGSNSINFIPAGNTTQVVMRSDCTTPSFGGNFLPIERNVDNDGFEANWKVLAINRSFSQIVSYNKWNQLGKYYNIEYSDDSDAFGVTLKKPVEQYQQNDRAVKYAYLIVLITFAIVFFIEIRRERPIHPIQYLLIGIALMLFYTLLLSFSEHLSFLVAYLIASVMTIALISLYLSAIMHDRKVGMLIAAILTLCYTFIFILLQIESYALLVGSVGLFIVLAIAMFASRKIDWYRKSNTVEPTETSE